MQRLLLIGCGDIGRRTLSLFSNYQRIYGLTRSAERAPALRALGVTPIVGNLDSPKSLARLAGLASHVLHLAPPQNYGPLDKRTRNLLAALSKSAILPQRLVYISTTGVYGDCQGDWVSEVRSTNPLSSRAIRRADAERQLRSWARRNTVQLSILRVPGIYAAERLPRQRLSLGTPAIVDNEDSYSNHIHAEDLANIVVAALRYGAPNRIYNACDNEPIKMGAYFDLVADKLGLPKSPRISRVDAVARLSPGLMSFLRESRRLTNGRMQTELRVRLQYPSVREFLAKSTITSGANDQRAGADPA